MRHTVIYNAVIEDERLRDGALEVLAYVLSKPDDWIIRQADLRRRFGYGRDRQRKIFRILEDAGYLTRERTSGEHGRFVWDYFIHELPGDDLAFAARSPLRRKKAEEDGATGTEGDASQDGDDMPDWI